MHQRCQPTGPAPRFGGIGSVLQEQSRELCVPLVDGFVETGVGEVGVSLQHLQRARDVTPVTEAAHRYLEVTARIPRWFLTARQRRQWLRRRVFKGADDGVQLAV